jgi:hypothetical protein
MILDSFIPYIKFRIAVVLLVVVVVLLTNLDAMPVTVG